MSIRFLTTAAKTMVFGFLFPFSAPASGSIPYAHPKSYFETRVDLSEPETYRIRKHLAKVEADLRANPPPGLDASRLEARVRRLDDLHAYRMRGEFPRNPDYPDSLVPYFIDARGVACAVGYLVIASGHRDFAEHVARTRNHAYIREITDPRLAEWAEASGLTLEECARIQPAYGGPTPYPFIREIEVSPQGAVWTIAAPDCLCSMTFHATSRLPGQNWNLAYPDQANQSTLCLDPSGRPLLGLGESGNSVGLLWEGKKIAASTDSHIWDCAWSKDGQSVWVAGNSALRQYRFTNNAFVFASQSAPRESVMVVAASRDFVWGGNRSAVFESRTQGSGTPIKLDTAGLAPFQVTGLKGQGSGSLWAGINGNHAKMPDIRLPYDPLSVPVFSRRGLLFHRGSDRGWTAYSRATAGLPSDTIQALAPADSQSVWLAFKDGLYKFTPPGSLSLVLSPFGAPVSDMATDSLGRLYIATWGKGVYRYDNGSTEPLGSYIVSSLQRPGSRSARTGIRLLWGSGSEMPPGSRSLLGRKADAFPNRGVFVYRQPEKH